LVRYFERSLHQDYTLKEKEGRSVFLRPVGERSGMLGFEVP
jgi:hypothetical protein